MYQVCTCGKAWMMVGEIPPCPLHGKHVAGEITYTRTYPITIREDRAAGTRQVWRGGELVAEGYIDDAGQLQTYAEWLAANPNVLTGSLYSSRPE